MTLLSATAVSVILGTGGAARCAHYLAHDMGAAQVVTVSRSPETADRALGAVDYAALDAMDAIDVLINTTPVGMHPHPDTCPRQYKRYPKERGRCRSHL